LAGGAGSFAGALGGLGLFGHEGGLVPRDLARRTLRLHGGGEVPAVLQSGEFVMRRWSTSSIGAEKLRQMNETGTIPAASTRSPGGQGGDVYNFSFNGVQDFDSFRRSRQQVLSDLSRAVRRGARNE
jgi:hypothetical protein